MFQSAPGREAGRCLEWLEKDMATGKLKSGVLTF